MKFKNGIVIVDGIELKVSYKPVIGDELFCISLENKKDYIIGQTFYINSKLLK